MMGLSIKSLVPTLDRDGRAMIEWAAPPTFKKIEIWVDRPGSRPVRVPLRGRRIVEGSPTWHLRVILYGYLEPFHKRPAAMAEVTIPENPDALAEFRRRKAAEMEVAIARMRESEAARARELEARLAELADHPVPLPPVPPRHEKPGPAEVEAGASPICRTCGTRLKVEGGMWGDSIAYTVCPTDEAEQIAWRETLPAEWAAAVSLMREYGVPVPHADAHALACILSPTPSPRAAARAEIEGFDAAR